MQEGIGRRELENNEGYELKEPQSPYNRVFDPEKCSLTYISYAQDILFLFQAIFIKKSVMYLQTTTIDHVNFYKPNSVPQLARRLFYAGR